MQKPAGLKDQAGGGPSFFMSANIFDFFKDLVFKILMKNESIELSLRENKTYFEITIGCRSKIIKAICINNYFGGN